MPACMPVTKTTQMFVLVLLNTIYSFTVRNMTDESSTASQILFNFGMPKLSNQLPCFIKLIQIIKSGVLTVFCYQKTANQ